MDHDCEAHGHIWVLGDIKCTICGTEFEGPADTYRPDGTAFGAPNDWLAQRPVGVVRAR